MEVPAEHLGNSKFDVIARGHRLICDQPRENGGNDSGMSPQSFYSRRWPRVPRTTPLQYLKVRSLTAQRLEVKVTPEKAQSFGGWLHFGSRSAPGLDAQQGATVESSLIRNSLLNQSIEVLLNTAALLAV